MECTWHGVAGIVIIPNRVVVFVGGAVVLGGAIGLAVNRRAPVVLPPSIEPPVEVDAGPLAAWCDPSLEPLVAGGCFAAPREAASPIPLVVYLHGMYERDAAPEELERQRRVAARATAKGFAVLALHGKEGGCNRPDLETWFCWPSNERTAR